MARLLYIIGQSNTGKTTCLNQVLGEPTGRFNWPISHEQYPGGIQLGIVREQFSGSDALGKHVQVSVPQWLWGPYKPGFVIGEGIRFCTRKFLQGCLANGWHIDLLRLTADPEVLKERQSHRTEAQLEWLAANKKAPVHRDHEQTEEFLKGTQTLIDKIYEEFPEWEGSHCHHSIDTTNGFDEVIQYLDTHAVTYMLRYGKRSTTDPGGEFFEEWHKLTMEGRELLKAAGVTRWQYELQMAQQGEKPEIEEGQHLYDIRDGWWIFADYWRETTYARQKRKRLEKQAAEELENAAEEQPSNDIACG